MLTHVKQFYQQKRSFVIFFAILISFAIVRISLILHFGDTAYGYDLGIYRRMISDCISGVLAHGTPGSTMCPVVQILSFAGISIDGMAIGGYVFFELLSIVLIYELFSATLHKKTALIGTFLFASSAITQVFFTEYFLRNSIALSLVLLALRFWNKPIIVGLCSTLLIIIHPISILPLALCATILFFVNPTYQRSFIAGSIGIGFGLIIAAPELQWYFHAFATQYLYPTVASVARANEFAGTFYSIGKSLMAYLPILIFIIVGVKTYWKKFPVLTAFGIASLILSIPGIPFAERQTLYASIPLLFFAALGVETLKKKHISITLLGFIGAVWISMTFFAMHALHKPLLETDIIQIMRIDTISPQPGYILTVSSLDAPWLVGYTKHRVIAPGVFDTDPWPDFFWKYTLTKETPEIEEIFMSALPRPLYFYQNNPHTHLYFESTLQKYAPQLWIVEKDGLPK